MFNPGTIFVAVIIYIIFLIFKAGHPHLEDLPQPVVIAGCIILASMFLHGRRREIYTEEKNKDNRPNEDAGNKSDKVEIT